MLTEVGVTTNILVILCLDVFSHNTDFHCLKVFRHDSGKSKENKTDIVEEGAVDHLVIGFTLGDLHSIL
jgi:hypothetical protein